MSRPDKKTKTVYLDSIPERQNSSWTETVEKEIDKRIPPESLVLDLSLPNAILSKLFDHQRVGVAWMHNLFKKNMGGVLGDDMGMGKTFQVVSLLTGLMLQGTISKVLILAPVAVLPGWERELN
eukprot:gene51339-62779_t